MKLEIRIVAGDPHLEWYGVYHSVLVFVEVYRWCEKDIGYRWGWMVQKSFDNGYMRMFVGAYEDDAVIRNRKEAIRQAFECLRLNVP